MKTASYFVLLFLAVACVILSVALVIETRHLSGMQADLQRGQQQLTSGVLGPQAQQISGRVLQDMGDAALTNSALRALLERHGYRVNTGAGPATNTPPATAAAAKEQESDQP